MRTETVDRLEVVGIVVAVAGLALTMIGVMFNFKVVLGIGVGLLGLFCVSIVIMLVATGKRN